MDSAGMLAEVKDCVTTGKWLNSCSVSFLRKGIQFGPSGVVVRIRSVTTHNSLSTALGVYTVATLGVDCRSELLWRCHSQVGQALGPALGKVDGQSSSLAVELGNPGASCQALA